MNRIAYLIAKIGVVEGKLAVVDVRIYSEEHPSEIGDKTAYALLWREEGEDFEDAHLKVADFVRSRARSQPWATIHALLKARS